MSTLPKQTLTAEEFGALDLGDARSELIEGVIHTMPPTFEDHGKITMRLSILLGHYVLTRRLGDTYVAETGFLLARNPDTVRAPDIAFIQRDWLPSPQPKPRWVPVIPDLVVEVASSGDRPAEIRRKAAMWMDVGVRLVWVVLPGERVVEIYRAGAAVTRLSDTDMLDGADVVPGFSTSVAAIFDE
jgi:Uma2 family endonuclease